MKLPEFTLPILLTAACGPTLRDEQVTKEVHTAMDEIHATPTILCQDAVDRVHARLMEAGFKPNEDRLSSGDYTVITAIGTAVSSSPPSMGVRFSDYLTVTAEDKQGLLVMETASCSKYPGRE
ncbi:MAG: hypothetical protein AAB383_00545 [Patescibacteria group bacterium]